MKLIESFSLGNGTVLMLPNFDDTCLSDTLRVGEMTFNKSEFMVEEYREIGCFSTPKTRFIKIKKKIKVLENTVVEFL